MALLSWSLQSLSDSDIIKQPIAIVPPTLTLVESQKKIVAEKLQGLVFYNSNNKLAGACTAGYLTNLPNDRTTPIESVMAWQKIQVIQSNIAIEKLFGNVITSPTANLLVCETEGKPIGIIEPWQLAQWLFKRVLLVECRLETILSTTNEAIAIIDQNNIVVGWNQRAEGLYKISAKEICGSPITSFFKDLMVTRVVQDSQEVNNAYHQPCAGTHVLINAKPIRRGQKIIGSVSAERDITEIVHLHQDLSRANTQVKILEKKISNINGQRNSFNRIMGHSPKLEETIDLARRVADTNAAVLIRGESGTGKELFAEAMHQESKRREEPFIVINCGAIPATLFESELFGYESGAFTGADRKGKPGKFELADGGTIFLDEIGELQLEMQVKLLRVLQKKGFYRIGGSKPIDVDVRIIAATHRDLEFMITQGLFREDLYYRLNVVSLEIPPLGERKEDIPELVYSFMHEFAHAHNRHVEQVAPEVMSILLSYAWPGNVRELRNIVERLVILAEAETIKTKHIPKHLNPTLQSFNADSAVTLTEITKHNEREIIIKALDQAKGNKALAARQLGIPRSTLYYKIKSLRLDQA